MHYALRRPRPRDEQQRITRQKGRHDDACFHKNDGEQDAVRNHDGSVALTAGDDGCRIAPEHLPPIFDRLHRVDAARSATDSTGLGLPVVRSIAEPHGGTVAFTSKMAHGTTFTL